MSISLQTRALIIMLVLLNGIPVSWFAKKKGDAFLLSTEAEFVVAS